MLTHSNSGKVFVAAATFSTPTCKIRLVAFRCKPCKGSSLEMYNKASSPTTLQSFMWEIKWKGLKRWYEQILFPSKLPKFRNLIKFNFGATKEANQPSLSQTPCWLVKVWKSCSPTNAPADSCMADTFRTSFKCQGWQSSEPSWLHSGARPPCVMKYL